MKRYGMVVQNNSITRNKDLEPYEGGKTLGIFKDGVREKKMFVNKFCYRSN